MPDRDKFRSLPGGWGRAAHSFEALARGKASELDQEAGAQGFVRDLAGGVQTLAATVEVFGDFNHQRPLVAELACEDLARATQERFCTWATISDALAYSPHVRWALTHARQSHSHSRCTDESLVALFNRHGAEVTAMLNGHARSRPFHKPGGKEARHALS